MAGAHLALRAGELRVVCGAGGGGENERGDGFAGGEAGFVAGGLGELAIHGGRDLGVAEKEIVLRVVQTGEDHDLIALAARGAVPVAAGSPAIQVRLEQTARQFQAWRTAEYDCGDSRPMRFTGAGDRKERPAKDFHQGSLAPTVVEFAASGASRSIPDNRSDGETRGGFRGRRLVTRRLHSRGAVIGSFVRGWLRFVPKSADIGDEGGDCGVILDAGACLHAGTDVDAPGTDGFER